MSETQRTWFHGYTKWYLRTLIVCIQAMVVGAILEFALGSIGLALAGPIAALLFFRQIHHHVRQEIEES